MPARPNRRARALAVGGAVVASLAVWAVARLADVELTLTTGGTAQEIGPVMVVMMSAPAGLVGWALLPYWKASTTEGAPSGP